MERVYPAEDDHDNMTLVAVEYRARLLRDRVKGCQN